MTSIELQPREVLPSKRTIYVIAGCLFIATLLVYARAVTFGFVGYDDFDYVVNNYNVHRGLTAATIKWATTSLFFSNYIPLTLLSYLGISTLFGTGPAAFHVVDVFLHGATVALFFLFLVKTGANIWVATFAAAVWGWHPLRVESVAWISELKDVLCGVFWLLTMLAYLRYVRQRNVASYLLTLLAYSAALAAKPMATSLPFVLWLIDLYPLRRIQHVARPSSLRALTVVILEKLPMLALGVGLSRITLIAQASTTHPFPLRVRVMNAFISTGVYVRDVIVPRHLAVFYPHPQVLGRPVSVLAFAISATALFIISILTIVLAIRRRPAALIGWLWFIGTLIPVIGLVQVGEQARADRYTYIPTLGLACALAWILSDKLILAKARRSTAYIALAIAGLIISVEVSITEHQLSFWRDSNSLFEHAIDVTDSNYLACSELANVRMHDHREAEALQWADRALAYRPRDKYSVTTRGLALVHLERYAEALQAFRSAISIDPKDAVLRRYAANVLFLLKKYDQAEQQLKRSLLLNDDDPATHDDYAALLADQKRFGEAVTQWRRAVAIDPKFANAHAGLARDAELKGDSSLAIAEYASAVRYAGDKAKTEWILNLAWLEATSPQSTDEQIDDSLAKVRKSVADPATASALDLDTLSASLARNGQFDDAVRIARQGAEKAYHEGNRAMGNSITRRAVQYSKGQPYIAGG